MAAAPHLDPAWQRLGERITAKVETHKPYTPKERLDGLRRIGFFPHGVFQPDDGGMRREVQAAVKAIGNIEDVDERMRRYYELQELGEQMEAAGYPGRWTGQMGVVRSDARFRIVAWGRRGGKTKLAASEAVAYALDRPRSVIWVAGATMDIVSRPFKIIDELIRDLDVKPEIRRSSAQTALLVLPNGSTIEGVSLVNFVNVAGAGVNKLILEEAANPLITAEVWERALMPPLADKQGEVLLISSFEGEQGFFYEKTLQARKRQSEGGASNPWAYFHDTSYDANFYMFPQGIMSPEIILQRENMGPLEFLEQFGAIPTKSRSLVYPEFRERVHVQPVPFDPMHPVIVGVDPSGGASNYGVVVAQDYGSHLNVIDEFYVPGVTAAEIDPILRVRPWRANVTDVVVDSAAFTEAEYWARLGWPAYPVFEKPPITERIPLHRNLLRDPKRYYDLYRMLMNDLLAEQGLPPNYDFIMPSNEQVPLVQQIEQSLSDQDITAENLALLRQCARLFIDPSCVFTIREHKTYTFRKKKQGTNVQENPADQNNDLMDPLGYLLWTFHRFDEYVLPPLSGTTSQSLVQDTRMNDVSPVIDLRQRTAEREERARRSFLETVRRQFASRPDPRRSRSLVSIR